VGVGKTCAAVTVAESYLHEYPARKVYVVAPPNIQEGFRRTIFDMKALKVVKGETNKHSGCTGDTYLDITGTYTEYNKATIESRVGKAVRSRYEFFGYTSFYNHILGLMSGVPTKGRTREQVVDAQNAVLREEFSNRVIIVDEAHNLRDNPLEGEEESADDANPSDSADAKAGKKLTPFFKRVLEVSDGISLLLMTATPMYNSFIEIIFLLNLLLINDKYPGMLRVDDVFNVKEKKFVEGGEKVLGRIAGHYISFMRGENPLTLALQKPEGRRYSRRRKVAQHQVAVCSRVLRRGRRADVQGKVPGNCELGRGHGNYEYGYPSASGELDFPWLGRRRFHGPYSSSRI